MSKVITSLTLSGTVYYIIALWNRDHEFTLDIISFDILSNSNSGLVNKLYSRFGRYGEKYLELVQDYYISVLDKLLRVHVERIYT